MKKTIVYVAVLMVVSLVAGALLGTIVARRQNQRKGNRISGKFTQSQGLKHQGGALERLSQALNLSPDQKVKLTEILKAARQEVVGTKDKTKEALREIKNKTDVKIREILTSEQQVKFDQIESKLQDKIEQRIAQRQKQKSN